MTDSYESPLCSRYAGKKMQQIFSADNKFSTWRRLWLALAESEQELGLNITDEQLDEMRAHLTDIDYELAAKKEHELRHDVMAHIHTFGAACPKAMPIIHLGATSCYVGDNTDIILQRQAFAEIRAGLLRAIAALADFAEKYKALPTLAYTHFQAAQPTTLGKRAALWMQDLMLDLEQLDFAAGNLKLLGCRGTTGTAASFLALFDGDGEKVKKLEALIAEKMGFSDVYAVSGQTYTRKVDFFTLSVLSGIAQSAMKFTNDVRLMAHMKELDEPFESKQVGSSAMAYKRNPMRCERVCSLSRYVVNLASNTADTAMTQWLERTLDDSANRRLTLPEAFLACDAILTLCANVVRGCKVYPRVMEKHLREELPFLATENILMRAVSLGEDRQKLHEVIRQYSVRAAESIKLRGEDGHLLDMLLADERFHLTPEALEELLDVRQFVGLAPEQTRAFLETHVYPVLEERRGDIAGSVPVRV